MNIHPCYTLRNLILASVLGIGFASSALAQERVLLVDLNSKEQPTLAHCGGKEHHRFGINNAGQVAATPQRQRAYPCLHHGPNGAGMTDLGSLGGDYSYALGINDEGQVVGRSTTANGLAMLSSPAPMAQA